jgi:hypothetical protein
MLRATHGGASDRPRRTTLDPNGLNLAGPRVVTIARPARSICATISPDCPFNVSGMTKADESLACASPAAPCARRREIPQPLNDSYAIGF